MIAALLISGRSWLGPVAVFLLVGAGLLLWVYRAESATRGVRLLCATLKLLGILTLAACLLEPLWSGRRARPGANVFVVLADNSQRMQVKDQGATENRAEFLRGLLTSEHQTWLAKLEDHFQLRKYYFDARVQNTRDFSEMAFDGRATSMGAALRTIAERYQGQPLSGVLLLTDGNATDLADGRLDATGLPPVYPVVIGSDNPIKDIAIQKVAVSQTAFEDAPVSLQADVTADGYAGQSIVAQVLDAAGAKVEEQSLKAPADGEVVPFHFQLKPGKPGISFYRVRVAAKGELEQFDKPELTKEATLANNSRVVMADRGKGPYRILYVGGRPKPEFKFMNRALSEDDQIDLVGLIRIAKREPKWDFRGRAGETSNPLFRGFTDQSKENIESYDKPVLERVQVRDPSELADGFPRTAEELYAFQAVVVDDMEAEFFTRDQMTLLQKFVSERGGGFLMMGGPDSFHDGHYDRTPMGDMLPVYLERAPENVALTNLHFSLTHEGWLQPWARLRSNETDERNRLDNMPLFDAVNRVRELKPGATAIANVHDEQGAEYPALVIQRFGSGRTAALLLPDLYQWGFAGGFTDESVHRDMDKAWRQMFRWLVSDVPNRIDFQVTQKRDDPNQAVLLQIRVRDKSYKPLDNATVVLDVRTVAAEPPGTNGVTAKLDAATNSVRLTADASSTEAGLYEASYIPRQTGGYLAGAVVTDSGGVEVGRAESGWTADPAADEFRSLRPNRALLEQIARQTGGEIIKADKLTEFAASLPSREAPITENWTYPLWHRSLVFAFALACFAGEWGIRRWKGMV
jgi:uncharacterized membrane protein